MLMLTDANIERIVAIDSWSIIAVYPHESQQGCVIYIEEIGALHVTQEFIDVVRLVEQAKEK